MAAAAASAAYSTDYEGYSGYKFMMMFCYLQGSGGEPREGQSACCSTSRAFDSPAVQPAIAACTQQGDQSTGACMHE